MRSGRARELRGIGPGLEARLRELVETGEIADARELEGEVEPELVGLGRFLGLSPKRAVEIGRALGSRTPPPSCARRSRRSSSSRFRASARRRRRSCATALAREDEPRARRGLLLNRARELAETLAEALDASRGRRPAPLGGRLERFASSSVAPDALDALRSAARDRLGRRAHAGRAVGG